MESAGPAKFELIDLTHPRFGDLLQTAGFYVPVAMTQKAAASIVYNVLEQPTTFENINSRILKVLRSLHRAMLETGSRSSTHFNVRSFNRCEKTTSLKCIRRPNTRGFIIMAQKENNHFN